jgi:hypothetical protein
MDPAYTHSKEKPFANLKQTRPKRPTLNADVSAADPPTRKPSLTELLNSWEPLSDEDAMPPIDKLTVEPFDL